MTTRKSSQLTLKDKLSRLTFRQASKLLGPDGEQHIMRGGRYTIDVDRQVSLTQRRFRLELFEPEACIVTISLQDNATRRLGWQCNTSEKACDEVGAAFALILEEKTLLGLAVEPDTPLQRAEMSDIELNALEITAREKRALDERMTVRSEIPKHLGLTTGLPTSHRVRRIAWRCVGIILVNPTAHVLIIERTPSAHANIFFMC